MTTRRHVLSGATALAAGIAASVLRAQSRPIDVLWWDGMVEQVGVTSLDRRNIAQYLRGYGGGTLFNVDYQYKSRGGALAQYLSGRSYDILILDVAHRRVLLNAADRQAIGQFYANGRRTLMLDGSFLIRSAPYARLTAFPGPDDSSGKLVVNQVLAVAQAGGGVIISADHGVWASNPNYALQSILPDASFTGTTNPSTDGEFIGRTLLGHRERIKALDILRHWESVPNQGEAPIGTFTDITGAAVTLYSLVEAADKPGGGRKRPYVSSTIDPGSARTAIDSEEIFENIPTHKSGG